MEQTKINKIHFLIHPGYFYEYSTQGHLTPEEAEEAVEIKKKAEILLDRYAEQAKTLGASELMFIFLPSSRKELKKHLKENNYFAQKINEIKKILGKRAVTITDDSYDVPYGNAEMQYEKVKNIAEARGFVFDKTVKSEAYGETLADCVLEGAESLNEAGEHDEKTLIKPELTDGPLEVNDEYDLEKHKKEANSSYRRVKYK